MPTKKNPNAYFDLTFPTSGLHVATAYDKQPPATTETGINVTAYDTFHDRLRGGSRPGFSKFISGQVNGSAAIQLLDYVPDTTIYTPSNAEKMNANRTIRLVSVAGGVMKVGYSGTWHAVTAAASPNAPTLSSTVSVMRSAYNSLILFMVDGTNYNYYAASNNTLYKWTATHGTLPVDVNGKACRHIATWRARTCLAGLPGDPNNWFFSAVYQGEGVGGGVDFDYSPAITEVTQAVSGNNAPAGLCGDIITALVPFSDDIMIFGGDHTIWAMNGDPMNGGRIDLLSDRVGMAWGDAWCKDPFGTVYFMSNQGSIYTIVPGQKPVKLSSQIESLLTSLHMDAINARLQWDENLQGFHVYCTYLASAQACIHYFWERRTGAWWQVEMDNVNHNPLTCVNFDGNLPGDRISLFGGWDGYVRGWSRDAVDDDGTAITSSVLLGPLSSANFVPLKLTELQSMLDMASGDVDFAVYCGDGEQAALASSPVVTGTLSAGASGGSNTQPCRRDAKATYIKLSSANRWAMERIRIQMKAGGKVKTRNKGTWSASTT